MIDVRVTEERRSRADFSQFARPVVTCGTLARSIAAILLEPYSGLPRASPAPAWAPEPTAWGRRAVVRTKRRHPRNPWIDAPQAPHPALLLQCMTSSGTLRASHLQIVIYYRARSPAPRLCSMRCGLPRGMPRIPIHPCAWKDERGMPGCGEPWKWSSPDWPSSAAAHVCPQSSR